MPRAFSSCRLRFIALIFLGFALAMAIPARSHARDALPGPLRGEVLDVLDGDTVDVRLHIWIGEDVVTHVRIAGIDAPEIHGKCTVEREQALAAKKALATLLADGKISLYNVRLAKYAGRVLAEVQNTEGVAIADYMVSKGFARPYWGKKRGSWCD